MKSILRAVSFLAVAAVLAPAVAQAAEPEKVVVRNRKFTTDGRFEASANVGLTLINYLTDHTNLTASLAYNISEQFAVEVNGGYALSSTTKVAKAVADVRAQDQNAQSVYANDFSDLWRLTWNTTAAVRWAPIYGKMNVAAELPVHFKAYLIGGLGYGGLERDSLVYCAAAGSFDTRKASCDPSQQTVGNNLGALHEKANRMLFVGGVGLRFFTNEWSALQVEVRDIFFQDSYRTGFKLSDAHQDKGILTPGGTPKYGTPVASPGLTHLPFVQLGATFSF